MADKFKAKVITPKEIAFDQEIDAVTIPAAMGEMQALYGHIPMLSTLVAGKIIMFDRGEIVAEFQIDEGFFRITKDEASFLVDNIISSNLPKEQI